MPSNHLPSLILPFLLLLTTTTTLTNASPLSFLHLTPRQDPSTNTTLPANTTLLPCGPANYDPNAYTCTNNATLCPILNGTATLPCADACYLPNLYRYARFFSSCAAKIAPWVCFALRVVYVTDDS